MLSLEKQNAWREEYRRHHPGWRPATEIFAGHVRAHLREGGRWLDVGCGRGGLVEQVRHPLEQTIGIDPDYPSLRQHRLSALPRAAAVSDLLPFAQYSFDLVTASWLLEHLPDPTATFAAIGRVLRPGGVFIFITPNARHPLSSLNRLAGRLGDLQGRLVNTIYGRSENDTFSTFYRANTPQSLGGLSQSAGLKLERLDLVADPSYLAFNRYLFNLMCAVDDRLSPDRSIHIVGICRQTGLLNL